MFRIVITSLGGEIFGLYASHLFHRCFFIYIRYVFPFSHMCFIGGLQTPSTFRVTLYYKTKHSFGSFINC